MDISVLNGKTIKQVDGCNEGSDRVTIWCEDGTQYRMHHQQSCCESVCINDVVGDPSDMIGLVVDAREESREATSEECSESGTWTFYIIQTVRGCVTLRWLGESNGYYSEEVCFGEVKS